MNNMKIPCWTRRGGCPQRAFVRLSDVPQDFAPNGGEEDMVEAVTVSREKLEQLAQALGVSYTDFDKDPEATLDEMISAANGNNGNGTEEADDFEDLDATEATREMGGMAMSFGPPRRFRTRAEANAAAERGANAFFAMLPPGRRPRPQR
jgi:hypothetical protein